MKIINLSENSTMYTSNVYLVLGTWNNLGDINTLVDVGRDPRVIKTLTDASTGVGKKKLDQVILTHCHYDHTSNLRLIREAFHPTVYALTTSLEGVDQFLYDREILILGDRVFEVIHMPGHSNDSVCFYCQDDGVLFAGDAPILIDTPDASFEEGSIRALERLCEIEVRRIYFGHGEPMFSKCNARLASSLKNAKESLGGVRK